MTGSPQKSLDKAPPPDRRGAFSLLFAALLAIGAGNTMLIAAVLPIMTRELGMQDWMAGAIFSLSAALWTVSSPFWGKKSSQWGRRPVAALGLAGYSLSMLLFGTVGWLALNDHLTGAYVIFGCLLFSRSFFGLVGSGASPAAQAYVADRTRVEDRTKEIASVTSGFSVGAVAGPAFAAAMVAVFGLLSPVFFTCALAALMSFLLYTRLPETTPPAISQAQKKASAAEAKGLWRDKRVLPFLIYAVGLSLVTGVLTQTFIFAVIDKMGVAGEAAAQFTATAFMAGAVGTLIAQLVIIPRLHISNRSLMIVGALTLALGAVMIFPTDAFAVLVSAQFLVGLGQGLARPGFSSGASLAVGPHLQGNVAGLVISANGMGFVVSPFFGPYVYEFVGQNLPFIMASVLLVMLAVFARYALPEDKVFDSKDEPTNTR